MTSYVALLRGINLAGKRRVSSPELVGVFRALGFKQVSTLLQSGNVLFCAGAAEATAIADALEHCLGFAVPVVLRTDAEMMRVLQQNPFADQPDTAEHLHVAFLSRALNTDQIDVDPAKAAEFESRFEPDRARIVGSHIYLYVPTGFGASKLPAFVDRQLKTAGRIGTVRNWRTTCKLQALLAGKTEA